MESNDIEHFHLPLKGTLLTYTMPRLIKNNKVICKRTILKYLDKLPLPGMRISAETFQMMHNFTWC